MAVYANVHTLSSPPLTAHNAVHSNQRLLIDNEPVLISYFIKMNSQAKRLRRYRPQVYTPRTFINTIHIPPPLKKKMLIRSRSTKWLERLTTNAIIASWAEFSDRSLKRLPSCYSQSPLLTDILHPHPPRVVMEKLMRKPQVWELSRLCPETSTKLYVRESAFWVQSPTPPTQLNIRGGRWSSIE